MSKTKFEECCENMINIFHQYSVRVGHFDMLSKGEFKQFVEKELPSYLKNQDPKKKAVIDELFAKFDKNKDQNMSFTEFLSFVSLVLATKHEQIHDEHHHH